MHRFVISIKAKREQKENKKRSSETLREGTTKNIKI
jgi:hypothetical protein